MDIYLFVHLVACKQVSLYTFTETWLDILGNQAERWKVTHAMEAVTVSRSSI